MTNRAPVDIELFLDVSCPWCHGAIESSRRLLDELAADPSVPSINLVWRFMRLHPMPRVGGMPMREMYEGYVGADDAAIEAAMQDVRDYVRSVGVRVDFARHDYLYDPLTAHRLLAAVRDDAADDLPSLWSLARAVWNANFVFGLDITDHAVLRGAVERGGLAVPQRIWELISSPDGHLSETLADHDRALAVELDGVPRMVIGGKVVPVWVAPDDVRRTVRDAIAAAEGAAG